MTITAAFIDSREPDWVKRLTFGGVPTMIDTMPAGDVSALTDDGHTLLIERKTPEDFLNSLRDDRLFIQMAKISETRLDQIATGQPVTQWPYLVITGHFQVDGGHVVTERRTTSWSAASVDGAILSIQEMGVWVVFCDGDADFEACVTRLSMRKRDGVMHLVPPKPGAIMGPGAALLSCLPGIGVEHTLEIMRWANGNIAHALVGLCDSKIDAPIGKVTRSRIRQMLGLRDKQAIDIWINSSGDEAFCMMEELA